MANHVAILNAYQISTASGGGFRGVFFVRATKERKASDRFETLAAATWWAKDAAHKAYAEQGYKLAPVRRKGEYLANVWVA